MGPPGGKRKIITHPENGVGGGGVVVAEDGAAGAAQAALKDRATEVASWRVESELVAVATELSKFPGDDSAKRFLAEDHARP